MIRWPALAAATLMVTGIGTLTPAAAAPLYGAFAIGNAASGHVETVAWGGRRRGGGGGWRGGPGWGGGWRGPGWGWGVGASIVGRYHRERDRPSLLVRTMLSLRLCAATAGRLEPAAVLCAAASSSALTARDAAAKINSA
jgi:hypothetical protein